MDFFIAFAVKSPIIPLHTWLLDTHGEAHYSTCMLLAGILLKMGAYGLVRINMELLPRAILGTIACNVGLAVLEQSMIGEPADPFATPLEILPEWYFFPVFQILRTVPNKLLGVLLMVSVPAGLLTVPFLENVNKFQNPFRRPVATTVFLIGTAVALWLGIGATLPIDKSLTLGLF